jgi:hypothetical protein
MEQNRFAQTRSKVTSFWSRSRQGLVALPYKARIVLAIFVLAALFLALHTALSGKDSSLHLRLQHGFRSAQLTVFVDGRRVYSGKIVGYSKKKYVLVGETIEGSLSQVFPVTSGNHNLLLRVESGDGTVQEETLSGVFVSGVGRTLSVSARHSGLKMSWVGESEAALTETAAESSNPSWFSKYVGSLFLAVVGSIASALTGLAIKELPGYLRTRQENVAKASSQSSGVS